MNDLLGPQWRMPTLPARYASSLGSLGGGLHCSLLADMWVGEGGQLLSLKESLRRDLREEFDG